MIRLRRLHVPLVNLIDQKENIVLLKKKIVNKELGIVEVTETNYITYPTFTTSW